MDKWWIEVERIPMQRGYRLWLTYHDGERRRILVAAHEVLDVEPNQIIDQATAVIPEDAAQQLIDELWRAGLRPSEGTGSAGALAATQKHLTDLRSMVFDGRESIMGMLAWLQRLAQAGTMQIGAQELMTTEYGLWSQGLGWWFDDTGRVFATGSMDYATVQLDHLRATVPSGGWGLRVFGEKGTDCDG